MKKQRSIYKTYLRMIFHLLVHQHRTWRKHNWSKNTCYYSRFWLEESFILKSNTTKIQQTKEKLQYLSDITKIWLTPVCGSGHFRLWILEAHNSSFDISELVPSDSVGRKWRIATSSCGMTDTDREVWLSDGPHKVGGFKHESTRKMARRQTEIRTETT